MPRNFGRCCGGRGGLDRREQLDLLLRGHLGRAAGDAVHAHLLLQLSVLSGSKSVHYEFSRCPNINTVGKWAQQTIHEAGGVSKQQKDKRISTQAFADEMKADHLYAAFASVPEMGGRDYWLLLTKSKAKKAKQAIRVVEGVTIRKDQYYIDAQWYLCTSESQDKKSYTLLDGLVQVPVASIVQEHGLKWDREFRNGENLLSKESHLAIARQNFNNVS